MKTKKRIYGRLNSALSGSFSKWRKGEKVEVTRLGVDNYLVQRLRWKGELPIQNQITGLPRRALTFL